METKIELILRLLDEEKINFAEAFILADKSNDSVNVREVTPMHPQAKGHFPTPGVPYWSAEPYLNPYQGTILTGTTATIGILKGKDMKPIIQKVDLHPDLGGKA